MLPLSVLQQIQDEMLSLPGVGSSVLEISHRSKEFDSILEDTTSRLRALGNIPDSHEILYLQGGAILQNAMVPMNLLADSSQSADYIVTGSWGKKSSSEVQRFGKLNIAWDGAESNYNRIPKQSELQLNPAASYLHLTSNETIQGIQFRELPDTNGVPIVADHSSDFLCEPTDFSKYGLVYACAQKNLGVAGVTVVVIDKHLLDRCNDRLPNSLNYAKHSAGGSRFNRSPGCGGAGSPRCAA